MDRSGYQEIDHTADWAIRVRAETLAELFEIAAQGMFSIANVKVGTRQQKSEQIKLRANDRESLLVLWLEELLYRIESKRIGIVESRVHKIDQTRLDAEIVTSDLISIGREIKAVTYHNLEIVNEGNRWRVDIVFDV